jgi:hypothetical protein
MHVTSFISQTTILMQSFQTAQAQQFLDESVRHTAMTCNLPEQSLVKRRLNICTSAPVSKWGLTACVLTAISIQCPHVLLLQKDKSRIVTLFMKGIPASKSLYDSRSVGQLVLESSPIWGLKIRFLLLSDSCGLVDVGRPL